MINDARRKGREKRQGKGIREGGRDLAFRGAERRGHYGGTGYYGVTRRHFNLIHHHHAADCSLQNRQRSGGDVRAQSVRTPSRVKRRRCVALRWLMSMHAPRPWP